MESAIIISESKRPYWQLVIAALLLTFAFYVLLISCLDISWSFKDVLPMAHSLEFVVFISAIAIGFCSHKCVYIDIENSRFKPTMEIGFIKIGKWKTIKNYKYVSVFYDPSKSESEQFEVNLWYDQNKHFELYTRNNFRDAMQIAYNLSEELEIDLLDASIKNDYKWIDKEELKQQANEQTS